MDYDYDLEISSIWYANFYPLLFGHGMFFTPTFDTVINRKILIFVLRENLSPLQSNTRAENKLIRSQFPKLVILIP